jgi:hypothetical protein
MMIDRSALALRLPYCASRIGGVYRLKAPYPPESRSKKGHADPREHHQARRSPTVAEARHTHGARTAEDRGHEVPVIAKRFPSGSRPGSRRGSRAPEVRAPSRIIHGKRDDDGLRSWMIGSEPVAPLIP